ncbi:MAG: M14 family zinc carboxypeptidase [Bacteroidota bacterium]
MRYLYFLLFISILTSSCKSSYKLRAYSLPDPVDTRDKEVQKIERGILKLSDGVGIRNDYPTARASGFSAIDNDTYQVDISAENYPINESPWFGFKIWADTNRDITLILQYQRFKHRYDPKISRDGENWSSLDTNLIVNDISGKRASFPLNVSQDTLWISAQEIQDYQDCLEWSSSIASNPNVRTEVIGKSRQGRDIIFIEMGKGASLKKPAIVVLSRQHPPEVTGYLAMQYFVERILDKGIDNGFLDKYNVLVYPMMNPDGVDLGYYRHNTGGVDLNRDWASYEQQEVRTIVKHIVEEAKKHKYDVQIGLDFHSTYRDVYYTLDDSVDRKMPWFTTVFVLNQ